MDPAVDAGFDAAIVQKCRKSREEVISDAETVKKRNRHHAQRMRSKPRKRLTRMRALFAT